MSDICMYRGGLTVEKYVMLDAQSSMAYWLHSANSRLIKKESSGFQKASQMCASIKIWCATLCTLGACRMQSSEYSFLANHVIFIFLPPTPPFPITNHPRSPRFPRNTPCHQVCTGSVF